MVKRLQASTAGGTSTISGPESDSSQKKNPSYFGKCLVGQHGLLC